MQLASCLAQGGGRIAPKREELLHYVWVVYISEVNYNDSLLLAVKHLKSDIVYRPMTTNLWHSGHFETNFAVKFLTYHQITSSSGYASAVYVVVYPFVRPSVRPFLCPSLRIVSKRLKESRKQRHTIVQRL